MDFFKQYNTRIFTLAICTTYNNTHKCLIIRLVRSSDVTCMNRSNNNYETVWIKTKKNECMYDICRQRMHRPPPPPPPQVDVDNDDDELFELLELVVVVVEAVVVDGSMNLLVSFFCSSASPCRFFSSSSSWLRNCPRVFFILDKTNFWSFIDSIEGKV